MGHLGGQSEKGLKMGPTYHQGWLQGKAAVMLLLPVHSIGGQGQA
jgi:hypothetical protein